MKKTILLILLLGLISVSSTSCSLLADEAPIVSEPAPTPDPVKLLEERIQTERDLRIEAQQEATEEVLLKERWQLAAIALCLLALFGFLAGTTIGSRGKRHAALA